MTITEKSELIEVKIYWQRKDCQTIV